jgi:phosphomannomutase/phosphoglucomutase
MSSVPSEIFKAYDVRGVVGKTLTPDIAQAVGRAIGSLARERRQGRVCIGRDGRLSGPSLSQALASGLQSAGVDVIDVGRVTTPMLYFATHHLRSGSGVMVTGSHNPPDYNGLKMVIAGETLSGETIQGLRQRIESGRLAAGKGTYSEAEIAQAYFARITGDIKLKRKMRIAVDCGNGVPGAFAPELFRRLGCDVVELFCEVDGTFPNHHPDPSQPENLRDLILALQQGKAEIGLAFDGDGDRLGVVTRQGKLIFPDRQLMLFAADVLGRHPGAQILFDVKCTRNLAPWIREHGGKPMMCKTGHSLIKSRMKETGALLAGEMSGHIFFKERWYGFDDGAYAGARLLEILSGAADIGAAFDSLPDSINTPELQIKLAEGESFAMIEKLRKNGRFPTAREIIEIDGLRVEYDDGFGLARSSNTTPVMVLRFEGDNAVALKRIQEEFRGVLRENMPGVTLPF